MNKLPPIQLPKIEFAREFTFSDADFERVRKIIYKEAGISLNPSKRIWCMAVWCGGSVT